MVSILDTANCRTRASFAAVDGMSKRFCVRAAFVDMHRVKHNSMVQVLLVAWLVAARSFSGAGTAHSTSTKIEPSFYATKHQRCR